MTLMKILIVEDEAIAAENIAGRLRQQGYAVVDIVDTGAAAIDAAAACQPDLVLMDIMLRGDVDGIAAAREIYHRWNIPVVYMTAFADDKTVDRAKGSEPFGYLVKPFKPQELKVVIEIALRKRQAEEALRQAIAQAKQLQQQAEAMGRLQHDFIAAISHEFRTPLSTIYLSANLLEHQGAHWSEEKRAKRFQNIRRAIERMTQLLDNALSVGKTELGVATVEPVSFDLCELCADTVEELSIVSEGSHDLVFLCPASLPKAYTDDKLLVRTLTNLISNAIKYSPQGSRVEVEVACDSGLVSLQVRDRGIGIAAEDCQHLFELFFRGANVGTAEGSGLGLAIVKHCVDLLAGTIAVASEVGEGTTVTVTFPLDCRAHPGQRGAEQETGVGLKSV